MTTFLDSYKGAEIYTFGEVDPSEGETLGSKLIAKAMIPGQENLKIDFIEEAATQNQALKKIKTTIDRYLDDHGMNKFEIDTG